MPVNHLQYDTLTLNGKILKGSGIVTYCRESGYEHLSQLGLFVKEWLSDSPLISIQTSGSTGAPKSIIVRKEQMLASAAMTAKFFGFAKVQSALLCLPVEYIAGKMMVVRALLSGLNLICVPPDAHPLSSLPENTMLDFAPLLPMQLEDATPSQKIKKILLGGAPVDPALEQKLQNFPASIFHGYGMTETLSHVAIRCVNGKERSDKYVALEGIHFETDERGCLIIHASFLEKAVLTNDVVALESSREFVWKGRADFVVNSGGVKLFPEEIEKKMVGLIREKYFLMGLPDKRLGEQLCLFIEGESYEKEKLQNLEHDMATRLSKFEKPKKILFISKFEVTLSGKIKRKATVDRFLNR